MSDSIILARLKRSGKTFELSIDPIKASAYKEGNLNDLAEALRSENIFTDARKGQVASTTELQAAFETTNKLEIAEFIIKKGELQSTSGQRNSEREQKRKQLINKIHTLAINPKTNLPHPATRIDAALNEAKIQIKDHQSIESQFEEIISKLRPIIPIKIEQKQLQITIQAKHLGAVNQFIRTNKLIKEDWTTEGNWQVTIEVPAGLVQNAIDTLNQKTQGSCQVNILEN
ncbi:ribosome assembly factor SBDS [archaeon]|jgi:ribosome maturation protein SDO1|nr:ribosome assembly factor SBDS [archaeon]MBT6762135.1 ribosome assembly factor SBDS [archaeon]